MLLDYCESQLRAIEKAEAEDIAEDAWIYFSLVLCPPRQEWIYRGWDYFGYLIRKRAKDRIKNVYRNRKETVEIEKYVNIFLSEDLETIILEKEKSDLLYEAIEKLPNNYREIVLLRIINRMSFSEIATKIGITVGSARSMYFRACRELEKILSPYVEDMIDK